MKISIISHLGYTFWEYLEAASEIGFRHIELPAEPGAWRSYPVTASRASGNYFPPEYADPGSQGPTLALKEKIESYNLKVSSLYGRVDFIQNESLRFEAEAEKVKELCDIAVLFDCDVVRISGPLGTLTRPWPYVRPEIGKRKCFQLVVDGFKKCVKYAEDTGVYLALENHGLLIEDGETILRIFKEVNSNHLGANIDTGNFIWYGYDPQTINKYVEMLAPHAYDTHIKDGVRWKDVHEAGAVNMCPLGEGEIDVKFLIAQLKKVGYNKSLNVQYEEVFDLRISPYEGLKKSYEYLKSLL